MLFFHIINNICYVKLPVNNWRHWKVFITFNSFEVMIDQQRQLHQNFAKLKQFVNADKNLGAIATLLGNITTIIRQGYFTQPQMDELFTYLLVLIPAIKKTYAVHIAALHLLEERRELFSNYIMAQPRKIFLILKEGAVHKNKDYKIKCHDVLMKVCEQMVVGITENYEKYKFVYNFLQKQIFEDLEVVEKGDEKEKDKDKEEKKNLNLLAIIKLLGIIAPLYVHYEGQQNFKDMFNFVMRKCSKKVIKEHNLNNSTQKLQDYKYILYAQKELMTLILSLAKIIQHLQSLDFDSAQRIQGIFVSAIRQSRTFLAKYEPNLWQSLVQMVNNMKMQNTIFSKWSKKVISLSLKQCLDSTKIGVDDDQSYIQMIKKASHLWRSFLGHQSWKAGAQKEFTYYLLNNIEYLVLNLNCKYHVVSMDEEREGFFQIFSLAKENIQMDQIQHYQYLSSLSILFHQIIQSIDFNLYSSQILLFYPKVLEKLNSDPKCLPHLRILRTLNQFILKNKLFRDLNPQKQQVIEKMAKFFNETVQIAFKFQQQYFYEVLKVLLSFPQEVYFYENHRILKHHLPNLFIKTFELGHQIVTLAYASLRCMQRIFQRQRKISESYLLPVISSLQKYIHLVTNSQRDQFKSQLFLFQLEITREIVSNQMLSFIGSLGGLCHQLVDNKTKDHISWDYDCRLQVQVNILNDNIDLNLTRLLNRACWLAINGKDDVKIVACEFLHAVITYVIEEIVSNKMTKQNLSIFLDRVLPTVLAISSNNSHPSHQLIHTLLIQLIHFFANTKQPNSPDIQIILKHLLSLYNKSQDLGYTASKCLSEFIRWHIKQQPQKNGNVPILKTLMGNIWSLVGNKNAREGIISFLTKLLKIIHKQSQIMRLYSIQLGFLMLSLARYNKAIQPQFKYLLQKYVACLSRYMKYLIIPEEGRRYSKTATIHEFLNDLYLNGFFSIYQQQRDVAFYIWLNVMKQNSQQLKRNQMNFLKDRSIKQKKLLFSSAKIIEFKSIEVYQLNKFCSKLIAFGEILAKLLEQKIFQQKQLVMNYIDFSVYLTSFESLLMYVGAAIKKGQNNWNQQIQMSILGNLATFLKLVNRLSIEVSYQFLCNKFQAKLLENILLDTIFHPDKVVKDINKTQLNNEIKQQFIDNYAYYLYINGKWYTRNFSLLNQLFILLHNCLRLNLTKVISEEEITCQRVIFAVSSLIKKAYIYQSENYQIKVRNQYLNDMLGNLIQCYKYPLFVRNHKIIDFVLNFPNQKIINFVFQELWLNSEIFIKHQHSIFLFIVKHWQVLKTKAVKESLASVQRIKFLYVLIIKLTKQQKISILSILPENQQIISTGILRDLLKINFLLVKDLDDFPNGYPRYLKNLIDIGLAVQNTIQTHEQCLYLCGIILYKKISQQSNLIKSLKVALNTITNRYCPFSISRLETADKQQKAMTIFNAIRNFIIISEQFTFIDQFYPLLKDNELSQTKKETINSYIEDCVRTCFNLENQRPYQWAENLLSFFFDENGDKDQWVNFRLLIIERIFSKIVSYIKIGFLQRIYEKYLLDVDKILKKPVPTDSLKSMLFDMQIKKGAFLIVELLYGNLPRRQKKQGVKDQSTMHKLFIKYAYDVCKRLPDESQLRLIRENDEKQGHNKKALRISKQYNCYAYNCLIVLFISTQSNKEHFKTYLFEHNKQALWDNFVDTTQTEFGFEIETSFKIMQPYAPLRNKIKQLKSKIQKNYFQSSLYVIEEDNVPSSMLAQIKQESDEQQEKEAVPIKNAHNIMLNTIIQEDVINKHPCMLNLLRVVDFLHTTFPQPSPSWMIPIDRYLQRPSISLAENILLIKLVLNRPNVFNQGDVWIKHILNYLALEENGSKFIHYFYRDALKRFISLLPTVDKRKLDIKKVNFVIMKIIKNLPHENVRAFSDNIDILQQLLRIPQVYVLKKTILNMLKNDGKQKSQWKMCAIITLTLCIRAGVPVLDQANYQKLRTTSEKFEFFFTEEQTHLSFSYEFATESKKYLAVVAGFLGELLKFISGSKMEQANRKKLLQSILSKSTNLLQKTFKIARKQKFALGLSKVCERFPQLLEDQTIFRMFENGLIDFSGQERFYLLNAFKHLCKDLLSFNEISKINNFFMLVRVNHQKILADANEVLIVFLEILNLCADPRLLKNKDISFTFYLMVNKCDILKNKTEHISLAYYQMLIKIKKYLVDADTKKFDFSEVFYTQIQGLLIEGLNTKFQSTSKMIFKQLQIEAAGINQPSNTLKYIKILMKTYSTKCEADWLTNALPLLLTLCRLSSDYGRLFSHTKLEENMIYYDWDFRNFKLNDSSLPYTPVTIFGDKKKQGSSQNPMGPSMISQGHNLRGMIRATQNNNLSQQEQIFTLLESVSSQSQQNPSQGYGYGQSIVEQQNEEETDKYNKINDWFKNKRKRNELFDKFKENNLNKTSPAVQFIQDKIRFTKNYNAQSGFTKRQRIQKKQKIRKGVILRAYKIGQLPNIEVSLQNIMQPLIFMSNRDNELASQLFLQFVGKLCDYSIKNCELFKTAIADLLFKSTLYTFNFVSTMEKCLIKLCQKHGAYFNISIKQIAMQSNTLDYAVLFTEQNIIQLLLDGDSDVNGLKTRKQKMYKQWFDLADYYQALNEPEMIESIMIKITQKKERDNLIKMIKCKKEGELHSVQKLLGQLAAEAANARVTQFIERQKIDCSVLLSEWEDICSDAEEKYERGLKFSQQEQKMLTIACQNLQALRRPRILSIVNIEGEKYEYQRGIMCLMKQNEKSRAINNFNTARQIFRRQWERVSSFAFNSKHEILQNLQKTHELKQFIELYQKTQSSEEQCIQLFHKWSSRRPNEIFDDNITWIQILSSRILFGTFLRDRWELSAQTLAKSKTQWLVQVVNGMIQKDVIGYAQNVIKRALQEHKKSGFFNWKFYQSVSQLKLMQVMKKGSLMLENYQIVPRLIQKQIDTYKQKSQLSKFKLFMIKNKYLQGFLEVCLDKKSQMEPGLFVMQVVNIFRNYQEVKNGLKSNNLQIEEGFHKSVHFKYALFLQNLLSIVKGKFQIKQIKQSLQKFRINTIDIATKFIEEVVNSISLLDLKSNAHLNYQEGQQLFTMILKVIKIVQREHKQLGKIFQNVVTDEKIPMWTFIYFIPQIINNINNFDLSIYFRELFEYLLTHYPQALVYPFNCSYPQRKDCHTQLAQYLYDQLHRKHAKYFEFIDKLYDVQQMKNCNKLSEGSPWFQDYNCNDWARIQVPGTSYNRFEEPEPWNKVYIESFENAILTLASIRKPKRITLLGSNQKVYMLLVKGGEDVRLDQRVEHLFDLVNRIFSHNTETNRKQLEISRFQVVPMKPMFGVFEWVDKSKTLKTFYQTQLKEIKGKPEANLVSQNDGLVQFVNYFKKICPNSNDRNAWHRALMARPQQQIVKNMGRCQSKIPYGLLRNGLEKLAKNYDSFLHIKNKFITNYSAICLVTYIFGIGDRHLENFLIQTSTGNLVMIDFGYSFGASIELPIPELIPFRLTKSFKELASPIGIQGSFKKSMLAAYEALRKKMNLIVDYCDLFIDDPLIQWVLNVRKQLNQTGPVQGIHSISSGAHSYSISQEMPEKKLLSNRIKTVQNKLKGYNPRLLLELLLVDSRHKSAPFVQHLKKAIWGKAVFKNETLSSEDLINELISLATDRNITGRSYIGLNLFI